MKKTFIALSLFIFIASNVFSQAVSEKKYSKKQLEEDLSYLKQQIFNVHINPYNELSKEQYEALFTKIDGRLKDSLTTIDFLKLVKPAVAY